MSNQQPSPADRDLQLHESEQRYQAVIENASDMIQSIRPDGTFEFVNKAWHEALGYTEQDLETLIIWDIIHPDEIEHCSIEFSKAIHGEPIDYIQTAFVAKDGRRVPVEGSATSRVVGDETIATHSFFRDISERIRTRELEERAARLEREERARYLEKMAALGKLSAGLAHELNNPAAAIQRAAGSLKETMRRRNAAMQELHQVEIDAATWGVINDLLLRALDGSDDASTDAIELGEQEEQIENWLEEHGIMDGWSIAPSLADAGISSADLEQISESLPPAAIPATMGWISESVAVCESTEIITQGSRRIAELVQAIKGYSHMDRATELEADIHDGIESTLVILGHRLRNIRIVRNYGQNIPKLRMFGNTLNQVWTNLIDNAIDAMDQQGHLRISTSLENASIIVEIEDSGKGIPEDELPRIFEPFYTSKPQGVGTGLGLDTVWRIITEEHGGTVSAESRPGSTVFRVSLPVTVETNAAA